MGKRMGMVVAVLVLVGLTAAAAWAAWPSWNYNANDLGGDTNSLQDRVDNLDTRLDLIGVTATNSTVSSGTVTGKLVTATTDDGTNAVYTTRTIVIQTGRIYSIGAEVVSTNSF